MVQAKGRRQGMLQLPHPPSCIAIKQMEAADQASDLTIFFIENKPKSNIHTRLDTNYTFRQQVIDQIINYDDAHYIWWSQGTGC